jgi:hypothetical protein
MPATAEGDLARRDVTANDARLRRQREEIVEECAQAEEGTVPRFLYRTVRDRAMELYYSQPAAWAPLRFAHPPQPEGYLDYWQRPDV